MGKVICIICSNSRGKRLCKNNNNSLICPVCCAKTRTPDCNGCVFYSQAKKYGKDKSPTRNVEESVIEISPEVNEKVDQALALAEKGKILTAEGMISTLLKKYPLVDATHYGMGVICLMKNNESAAIPYFEKALKLNSLFVEAWFNKGAAHQKLLEVHQMIIAYRKVIEIGDRSEHFVNHAKKILNDFERGVRKGSNMNSIDDYLIAQTIFDEAYESMEKMELDKAIKGFKKILSKDPQHVQSYGNLGVCYMHIGKKQEALAYLNKALELDPDYEPAMINKEACLSLKEGEKISDHQGFGVDYYKEKVKSKR